jgi:rhodanese-related sulfurtransferase
MAFNYATAQEVMHINAKEFKDLLSTENGILLDVRTPEEVVSGQIENACTLNYYADGFEDKLKLIQKNKTVFVYCHSGCTPLITF